MSDIDKENKKIHVSLPLSNKEGKEYNYTIKMITTYDETIKTAAVDYNTELPRSAYIRRKKIGEKLARDGAIVRYAKIPSTLFKNMVCRKWDEVSQESVDTVKMMSLCNDKEFSDEKSVAMKILKSGIREFRNCTFDSLNFHDINKELHKGILGNINYSYHGWTTTGVSGRIGAFNHPYSLGSELCDSVSFINCQFKNCLLSNISFSIDISQNKIEGKYKTEEQQQLSPEEMLEKGINPYSEERLKNIIYKPKKYEWDAEPGHLQNLADYIPKSELTGFAAYFEKKFAPDNLENLNPYEKQFQPTNYSFYKNLNEECSRPDTTAFDILQILDKYCSHSSNEFEKNFSEYYGEKLKQNNITFDTTSYRRDYENMLNRLWNDDRDMHSLLTDVGTSWAVNKKTLEILPKQEILEFLDYYEKRSEDFKLPQHVKERYNSPEFTNRAMLVDLHKNGYKYNYNHSFPRLVYEDFKKAKKMRVSHDNYVNRRKEFLGNLGEYIEGKTTKKPIDLSPGPKPVTQSQGIKK